MNRNLGVLISGRGTNLQAIIRAIADRRLDARIAVVISNRREAAGLDRAREAGIETLCIGHRDFATRGDYDRRLVEELRAREVGLVCLAGFMRLSGYRTGQFYGESLEFGRMVYLYKLSKAVLTEGVYAGMSFEAGRIGGPLIQGSPTGVLPSGALILAADTVLGPVYVAYGVAEHDNKSFYFFLGLPQF